MRKRSCAGRTSNGHGSAARLRSLSRFQSDRFQEEGHARMRRLSAVAATLATAATMLVVSAPALASDGLSNHAPSRAAFAWLPSAPDSGADITLTGTASDADGDALAYRWDLDDDGTFETVGRVGRTRLGRGKRKVRLLVSVLWGASAPASHDITVA